MNVRGMCVTDKEEEQEKKTPIGGDKSTEQTCNEQVPREGGCTDEWVPAPLSSGTVMLSVLLCKIRVPLPESR